MNFKVATKESHVCTRASLCWLGVHMRTLAVGVLALAAAASAAKKTAKPSTDCHVTASYDDVRRATTH